MGVSSKLTPNSINEDLRVIKIFLEKNFEFRLYNKNGALVAMLIMDLTKTNSATKE